VLKAPEGGKLTINYDESWQRKAGTIVAAESWHHRGSGKRAPSWQRKAGTIVAAESWPPTT